VCACLRVCVRSKDKLSRSNRCRGNQHPRFALTRDTMLAIVGRFSWSASAAAKPFFPLFLPFLIATLVFVERKEYGK